jgi:hypothetical protein
MTQAMDAQAEAFSKRWHEAVARRDVDGLLDLLSDEPSLAAPPYWQPFRGRELVHHLLGVILQTIEGFTYRREWANGRELALEFRGSVDGLDLQGIDLITLDEAGRLANLDVMIRPMNAVEALMKHVRPRMVAFLEAQASSD